MLIVWVENECIVCEEEMEMVVWVGGDGRVERGGGGGGYGYN